MRKLIITIVLTAFIVTLSSPILNAAQWDPATGPKWPERAYTEIPAYSGDDTPWVEPTKTSNLHDIYDINRLNFFLSNYIMKFIVFIGPGILTQPQEEEITQNYNGRQN